MSRWLLYFPLLFAFAVTPLYAAQAQGYNSQLPACEMALPRISEEFAYTQAYFWQITPVIVAYRDVREVAENPWAPETIPRRYCEATALVDDPRLPEMRTHKIRYNISEGTGFEGVGAGIEWCVTGYDWNFAYKPRCKMAGP